MISIVRKTFEERYEKYLEDYDMSKRYLIQRLNTMPPEEIAYLLAIHDKFLRADCAEYAADDNIGYKMSAIDSSGNYLETEYDGQERLPDPLGREVDPWGRPIKK